MSIDTAPLGPLDDPLGDIDEREMLIDKVAELEAERNDLAIRWAQSSQQVASLTVLVEWMLKKIDNCPIGLDESNWTIKARATLAKAGV